jgi:hypothetical protein
MPAGFAHPDYEEPYLGLPRDGSVLVTSGQVLLMMAVIPAMFISDDLRAGANFCLIWAALQGGLGLVLAAVGARFEDRLNAPGKPWLERWILFEETAP